VGFLREQSTRLLREDGWSAQGLADELFAIFNAEVPFTIDGPVVIVNTDNAPAITIDQAGPLDTVFEIRRPGIPSVQLPDIPPLTLGGDDIPNGHPRDTRIGSDGFVVGGGGGIPGVVVSGTGDTYQVLLRDGRTVTVTQLQIDPTATIPAGSAAFVTLYQGAFVMLVPVWL
jgi:hypothetical protein